MKACVGVEAPQLALLVSPCYLASWLVLPEGGFSLNPLQHLIRYSFCHAPVGLIGCHGQARFDLCALAGSVKVMQASL